MAKQTINLGTGPNTKDGDVIRDAFNKVNQNFNELYAFSAGTPIDLSAVDQHIIPATDVTYDLGSPTNRFRELFLSGNTIDLGGSRISAAPDGTVAVPGISVLYYVADSIEDYGLTNPPVDWDEVNNGPYVPAYYPDTPVIIDQFTYFLANQSDEGSLAARAGYVPTVYTPTMALGENGYTIASIAITTPGSYDPSNAVTVGIEVVNTDNMWALPRNTDINDWNALAAAIADVDSYAGPIQAGVNMVATTSAIVRSSSVSFNDLTNVPTIPTDISDLADAQGLLSQGGGNTGDVTFEGVKVIGAGTASGDGAGYATLELVPDNNLYNTNQYLVIDPTAPSHIHIRAGGPQDASNAELFLGGEKNHVRVNDLNGVVLKNEVSSDSFYYYNNGVEFTDATWFEETGSYYVQFTTTNPIMVSNFWDYTNGAPNALRIYDQNFNSYLLTYGVTASNLSPNVYKVQVVEAPVVPDFSVTALEFQIFTTNFNELQLTNNDFRVDVADDIRMFSRDIFRLVNRSIDEPIEITTDDNNNSYTWAFNPTGSLRLPGGAEINSANNNIELTVGTSTYTFSYDQMVGSSLEIPGSIQGPAQTSFLSANGLGISIDGFNSPNTVDIGNIPSSTVLRLKDGDGAGNIIVAALGTSLKLQTNNNSTWEFNDNSGLTFPDNTVQTTAYQGSVVTTVAKTGSDTPATGEVATVTLSPTNNTNFVPGTYPGIFIGLNAGFSITLVVAENGDLSATIINSNGGFTVGDSGGINGAAIAGGTTLVDDITITVATLTNIASPTALDLTKQVQKLTDGYYTLADGVEGQIMYFVQQTGATGTARIYVSNCRISGTVYIDNFIDPFAVGTNMVQMLFTDGAWQSIGGQWD